MAAEDACWGAADEVITVPAHDPGKLLTSLHGRLDLRHRSLTTRWNERELDHVETPVRTPAGIRQLVAQLPNAAGLAPTLQPVVVAAHGGTLTIESGLGTETGFCVSL